MWRVFAVNIAFTIVWLTNLELVLKIIFVVLINLTLFLLTTIKTWKYHHLEEISLVTLITIHHVVFTNYELWIVIIHSGETEPKDHMPCHLYQDVASKGANNVASMILKTLSGTGIMREVKKEVNNIVFHFPSHPLSSIHLQIVHSWLGANWDYPPCLLQT